MYMANYPTLLQFIVTFYIFSPDCSGKPVVAEAGPQI